MKKTGIILLVVLIIIVLLTGAAVAAGIPADGIYTVNVTLSGGSGRASVDSPTVLTVTDGTATAVIIWSSPYYEHMTVGGETYYPVNDDGNSAFEIPVALDEDITVSALTVAMSEPHEIDYTLHFDSATIKSADSGAPAIMYISIASVAVIAAVVAVLISRKTVAKRARNQHSDGTG